VQPNVFGHTDFSDGFDVVDDSAWLTGGRECDNGGVRVYAV